MSSNWGLRQVFEDAPIYELVAESTGKGPLERFASKKGNREAALYLASTLRSISRAGFQASFATGLMKRLSGDLVEVRIKGLVVRALAVIGGKGPKLVIISIERGHQGTDNMARFMKTARGRAAAARRVVDELDEGGENA